MHLRLHRIKARIHGIKARIRTLLKGANAIVNAIKAAIETRILWISLMLASTR